MSKDTLFHDFFHNPEARGEYSGCNVSFRGDKFYSYSTVIGQKFYKGKTPYLILSSNTMSPTTGRHLRKLRHACPYGYKNILYAPFVYGYSSGYSIESIIIRFSNEAERYLKKPERLNRANHRHEARSLVIDYARFRLVFKKGASKHAEKLAKIINEIDEKRNKPVDPVKAEKRRLARERLLAKKLEAVKDWTYMDKVKFCFDPKSKGAFNSKTRHELVRSILESISNKLGGFHRNSFIWIDGDQVVTSQHIRLPVAIVKRAINTWRKSGINAVHQIGSYTLDEVNDKYMKIGCHYIPMENILELEKELNGLEA